MKQDMNGVRTAQDLEQKYDFNGIKELKDQTEINRQEIISTNKELKDFVENVTDDLGKLQNQIDGNITTYFDSGVPTLSNFPANEWVTDTDKNNHLGDLYYDKDTGYSYRFTLEKDGYKWIKLTDSDVTEALAIANSAKDTADKKRRVFLEQPKPPYDNGDMWIKDQEIWICQISKQEGVFEERDFINNLKYTDDTKANEVDGKLTVVSGTVAEIQKGVNEISSTLTETQKLVDENGKQIGIVGEQITKINQTTDSITASVSSLSTTTQQLSEKSDKNSKDINDTKTNLNNNYYDKNYVDGVTDANTKEITQIKQEVATKVTAEDLKIEISKVKSEGATSVKTATGFTFDEKGLSIGKADSEMSSLLDNDGLSVKRNDTEVLSVRSDGVNTENLKVRTYFTIGKNTRVEDYKGGTGFFFIGGV